MTAVVAVLCVVVGVLTLLVAGLLRSHAAILRQLHDAGLADLDGRGDTPTAAGANAVRPNDAPPGRRAPDLSGVKPDGDPVVVAVGGRRHDTSLLFLSADCATCESFWEAVGDDRVHDLDDAGNRVVVVTRDPESELAGSIAARPASVPVVMSTQAWKDYQVPGSPYIVQVDGPSGRVRGEGTSASWESLVDLADRGSTETRSRMRSSGSRTRGADRRPVRDSDEELHAIGIEPGDPTLYPGSGDREGDPR